MIDFLGEVMTNTLTLTHTHKLKKMGEEITIRIV